MVVYDQPENFYIKYSSGETNSSGIVNCIFIGSCSSQTKPSNLSSACISEQRPAKFNESADLSSFVCFDYVLQLLCT